jgi:hypothetical protein
MSEKVNMNDGGPAFPWGEHGTHLGGISKRDYFAAKAMQTFLTGVNVHEIRFEYYKKITVAAYSFADAMLEASKS